jgi:gas vesicle protein
MVHDNHLNCFLKGAIMGGLTGTIAALLLAPKSGRELRGDLACTYDDLCDKSQHFSDQVREKSHEMMHAFDRNHSKHEENNTSSMLMGGAFGAILGATSALLLAPRSGDKLRQGLGEKYDEIISQAQDFIANVNHKGHDAMEYADEWRETLSTLVNKLSNSKGKRSNSMFDEIVDWANLGIKALQQLQKRR